MDKKAFVTYSNIINLVLDLHFPAGHADIEKEIKNFMKRVPQYHKLSQK